MSVTPGPVAMPSVDAERPRGRGPRVEHRVHVADQEDPRPAGAALERRDHGVAEPARRIRPALDATAEPLEEAAVQPPTTLTPSGV